MGIEHQRIHIETSSMLIRQLPVDLVTKPDQWQYAQSQNRTIENRMIPVDGGIVRLGKQPNDNLYGWDIDYGHKTVEVEPFAVSQYMITNGEFLEFVQAGGYQNKSYWSPEGWQWKENQGIIDPAKVVRSVLQNAGSIAGMVLTTEALVVEKPEPEAAAPDMGGMGGMGGGMPGMGGMGMPGMGMM